MNNFFSSYSFYDILLNIFSSNIKNLKFSVFNSSIYYLFVNFAALNLYKVCSTVYPDETTAFPTINSENLLT